MKWREWEEAIEARLENAGVCSLDMGGDAPPAPDYTPVAQASEESARIAAEQADRVLAESQRQYDLNMEVAKPIVDAQTRIMEETERQGKDYYDYMVSRQRPVEDALNADAMAAGSDAKAEEMAGKAMADVRQGTTGMQNQLIRQGLRYGYSPAKLAAMAGTMAGQQGLSVASAANTARQKEKDLGYAKKMDVAGLYRGLPGASQGAYSVATNAGNSATANQNAPGNALIAGMGTAGNMTIAGQGQKLSGLSSILNAQTSIFNNSQSNDGLGGMLAGLGGIGQGLGAMKTAGFFAGSDRRLKENIERVGVDDNTGLNLYEFNYKSDPDHRYRGVMADEVELIVPDAVVYDDLGFASVNYGMLGIRMEEV